MGTHFEPSERTSAFVVPPPAAHAEVAQSVTVKLYPVFVEAGGRFEYVLSGKRDLPPVASRTALSEVCPKQDGTRITAIMANLFIDALPLWAFVADAEGSEYFAWPMLKAKSGNSPYPYLTSI
jgi:hypothetical protein